MTWDPAQFLAFAGRRLRPYLDVLDEPRRSDFEADYRKRIRDAYPERSDGTTLFPFRRLLIVAVY